MLVDYQKFGGIPWKNSYQKYNSVILQGKKARHLAEIMAALALNGQCTTRQMAKFVLGNLPHYEYKPPRNKESANLEKQYNRLLAGIERKKTGRKKSDERYPWLVKEGYIVKTQIIKNEKKKYVQTYFLTLKGCFFALGFNFNRNETLKFLENATKNHLYFAYINKIARKASYALVKEIFIEPIQDIIKKGLISLDNDLTFYFSNMVEAHSKVLSEKIGKLLVSLYQKDEDYENHPRSKNIQSLMKCTYYDENLTTDWGDFMKEYFYKKPEEQDFFEDYCDKGIETNFLFRTMKAIHFGYFNGFSFGIPPRTQKVSFSKKWKEYKKFHPEYKSPRDYDRTKRIVLRH